MDAEAISKALQQLGYSRRWLETGVLNLPTLLQQWEGYGTAERPASEHCRFATFRQYLSSRSKLSDIELAAYLELAHQDPDQSMAQAALMAVAFWPHLTPMQYAALEQDPRFAAPVFQKRFQRERWLRDLAEMPLTSDRFAAAFASGDREVQRYLVTRPELTLPQALQLAEQGINRTVRHLATQRVQQLKAHAKRQFSM